MQATADHVSQTQREHERQLEELHRRLSERVDGARTVTAEGGRSWLLPLVLLVVVAAGAGLYGFRKFRGLMDVDLLWKQTKTKV